MFKSVLLIAFALTLAGIGVSQSQSGDSGQPPFFRATLAEEALLSQLLTKLTETKTEVEIGIREFVEDLQRDLNVGGVPNRDLPSDLRQWLQAAIENGNRVLNDLKSLYDEFQRPFEDLSNALERS